MTSTLEDKMKEIDGSYECRLRWKKKQKNTMDRIGVVYAKNKTRDMTDSIDVVYAGRQNERTQRIVLVSSMLKKKNQET